MNQLCHTNIEWVKNSDKSKGYVWNPVWGCYNNCPYCYAQKIAKRFAKKIADKEINYWADQKVMSLKSSSEYNKNLYEDLRNFKPSWLESNFQKKFPKKSSRIFVNSMSDIEYWEDRWMNRVIDRIKEYPQHIFMFLTKNMNIYGDYLFPENCWLGYTFTTQKQLDEFMFGEDAYFPDRNKFFISLEPIQEFVKIIFDVDWLIIGTETGNRKNKIVPSKKWIEKIVKMCSYDNIPVFLKNNLKSVWGNKLIQEFPE